MSVYVDPLFQWPLYQTAPAARATARRNGGFWCHLTADTPEELHAFAGAIGLRPDWYQDRAVPHYDLTPGKRVLAIRLGVREINEGQAAELYRRLRREAAARRGVACCRECGCTDDCACPGGCWWVEPDLCSRCAGVDV